ncbi:UCH domain-containing protein [Cephalotus follicularis]|uniref:UCH domain-containing protein n=1 Tax=Cephalotus follicularis TaxID=3775 RepID=A0A1Q3AT00_CEPFO|nr:UCH domain-containing protein [Cephalotus follicularis]
MSLVNYTSRALFAYKFVRHITLFSSSFTPFKQEDSHEFLLGVLNLLEMKFNDIVILSTCKPNQIINPSKSFFQCFVTHSLTCPIRQHTSIQFEPCYGLSLGINKEKSLIDALSFHAKTKEIPDVSCNYCGSRVTARRRTSLKEGSSFLIGLTPLLPLELYTLCPIGP